MKATPRSVLVPVLPRPRRPLHALALYYIVGVRFQPPTNHEKSFCIQHQASKAIQMFKNSFEYHRKNAQLCGFLASLSPSPTLPVSFCHSPALSCCLFLDDFAAAIATVNPLCLLQQQQPVSRANFNFNCCNFNGLPRGIFTLAARLFATMHYTSKFCIYCFEEVQTFVAFKGCFNRKFCILNNDYENIFHKFYKKQL